VSAYLGDEVRDAARPSAAACAAYAMNVVNGVEWEVEVDHMCHIHSVFFFFARHVSRLSCGIYI
jgi:hypothetical protein